MLLLDIYTKPITFKAAKLPTATASQKQKNKTDNITKDLYFFDTKYLFESILSSDIGNKIYQELGKWVDNPIELWHSFTWMSSARTISGIYIHYPDGAPIFPSEFVLFRIPREDINNEYIGRVLAIGRDMHSEAETPGQVTLIVQ
jgi:hypothetical protein